MRHKLLSPLLILVLLAGVLLPAGLAPSAQAFAPTTSSGSPGLATTGDNRLACLLPNASAGRVQVQAEVLINEFDSQTPGTDAAELIELYDGGTGNTSLDGLVIVFFNGNAVSDTSYYALDLDGYSTDANGYFVAGNEAVPGVDLIFPGNTLQNGHDAIGLYAGDSVEFPNGTLPTNTNLIDAVVYDDFPPGVDDPPLRAILLNPDQPLVLEGDDANNYSAGRCPNGSGGLRNTYTYTPTLPSPDGPNDCPAPPTPDAAIDKTGPDIAGQGERITYTVTYEMLTAGEGQNLRITDTLPAEVTFVTFTSQLPVTLTSYPNPLVFDAGDLAGYASNVISVVVDVSSTVPYGTVLTNTVELACDDDGNLGNNSADWTTVVSPLDLVVDKGGPQYGMAGENLVYGVTVQNVGVDPAANVVLTDVLPLAITYVADNSGWTCPACTPGSPGPLVWAVGTVSGGASFTFQLTVAADAAISNGTTLTNTVTAHTTTVGDNPANNSAAWATTFYPLVSIYDIQYVPDPGSNDLSPYNGQTVWVRGGVVGGYYSGSVRGYALADPEAAYGPWQGLFAYDLDRTPSEGQVLLLLGEVEEYYHLTEFHPIESAVITESWPLPDPVVTSTAAISDVTPHAAEALEGVLVEVRCATVTAEDLGYGEWGITDASGVQARVDDLGYAYSPVLGEAFVYIRGMLYYSYDDYKLEPRYAADLAAAPVVQSTDPAGGATDVPIATDVQATFNMSLTAASVSTATFFLEGPGGMAVPAAVSYDDGTYTALLDPAADLAYETSYTATLTTAILSYWGDPLCQEYVWSFTTAAEAAPDLGPSFKIADPAALYPGDLLTYTIRLINVGQGDAAATVTDVVPLEVDVVTATLPAYWSYTAGQLLWSGVVTAGTQVPLVFQARAHADLAGGEFFTNVVWINDGVHDAFQKPAAVEVLPLPQQSWTVYLPIVYRGAGR